ncbi:two-component system sensor histidine kinase KdpD [Undibacterium sp. RTI2.1]|uniref:two-component system sensor histidine kinase KdpD n=1 Tax=unclassified Undibacterium TaxID=2630295 RepID=UPI002AB34D49|nr:MULTISPECIES: two-component system sensor histidine kinase KdpD [unclassified Undibacterium]MDY7537449.1 two-component system sensor histidine kinase KdpD [Undibacterium sp. 5I1]MEB0032260.1 two-component system sensor histidine kinase KdpD [Undibacterium sp. RTI2.1]MEB0118396.1 two-component system sensor histidine kinase KdpD [Undibacterium sp. RTI2.2]MEB0232067.1 two-component system sensor histidine kinase KdpD [Undibacterium sp. 10I3]MEB0259356.1 two-component system sensor histidine k
MANIHDQRPDPDILLAHVQAQERRATRGKLRIYFGASAGVGKTYAMLSAAHKLQSEGQPVLIGVVETHGRRETLALLDGLEILPPKAINYRDKTLTEFDLDAALERKPPLILMDELAHSNAPGSRHPKRWQDVEELLDAGIDVYTTVNVQHLDSLNDVVGGITGIRVAETVPDTVFDEADEVVLVDVPADELLARLQSGRVYKPQQAERAAKNFFRKGNLIALRELALRRTADRVEEDVQAYRIEKSIGKVWKTDAALLACVGPGFGADHLIRSAARLASQLSAEWHAVYVETPQLQRLSAAQRERILKSLKLAQDLGAKTAVLTGQDVATAVVDYAHSLNFSKIVVGRRGTSWSQTSIHKRIAGLAPDLDLIEIGRAVSHDENAERAEKEERVEQFNAAGSDWDRAEDPVRSARGFRKQLRYLYALLAITGTSVLCTPLLDHLHLVNIAMLFMLAVVLVALRLGRGPSVLATVIGVATFDFFFVPPRFTFAVSDLQYLITFCVMLAVGLITGHLTAGLRYQARVSAHRESRARALYEFARDLSGVLQSEQISESTQAIIQRAFRATATLLLPDDAGKLQAPQTPVEGLDLGIAQWAFDKVEAAGMGTDTLPASSFFYLPLVAPMRTRGLLVIRPDNRRWILIPEQRQQLDTFAALAAIALERVHYIEVAQNALIHMESERLRNSLLAALSHDLRTPLTSLVGISESLTMSKPTLSDAQQQMAQVLHDEAIRMSALVSNLLDMARIQSGEVKLNLQWQPLEEVVGSSLRASTAALAQYQVQTKLPRDLPLLHFDAVLIERVLCNLLENAAKYSPPQSLIVIRAEVDAHNSVVRVMVDDNGPGLPIGREEAIFEKFTRGERESATPGVGLGLAICRAIIEAHNGRIAAAHSQEGGACICFTLPLGTPPMLPEPELLV